MRNKIYFGRYLKFLPLLLVYVIIVFLKQKDVFIGDESRYWEYASNLINGYYADLNSDEYHFLWNGPGLPIVLIPFVFFGAPLLSVKLFNAILIYVSVVIFNKTLELINVRKRIAQVLAYAFGLYLPFLFQALPFVLTEAISFFYVTVFAYFILHYFKCRKRKHFFLACSCLTLLILTKVIFVYVLYILLIAYFIHFIITKNKKSIIVAKLLLTSFLLTTPYLLYTYKLTSKVFYFANSGGMSLYWMSTPYENEYGDWVFFDTLKDYEDIYENHKDYVSFIKDLPPVLKDDMLKETAISNILRNKKKFFKNVLFNINRLFFDFPYHNQGDMSSFYFMTIIWSNAILLTLLIASFLILIFNYRKYRFELVLIILFVSIYISGVSLVSAYGRFLYPILPFLFLIIIYSIKLFLNKYVMQSIKSEDNTKLN